LIATAFSAGVMLWKGCQGAQRSPAERQIYS